jgi:Tol biopolymer transport system component/predicted Ser/Thr protein kinase
MALAAGDKLGPYEILALIGAGGMGEVYRARDPRVNREVAIKRSHAQFTERFSAEARAIAALNHTNICHLYDVGSDYLVMEYVEGETLAGPLPLHEALPIFYQLIDGIEAAHEKNIIHRDLKPANIKITADGIVKILDFGLAKALEEPRGREASLEDSPTLTMGATRAGTILGTAAYMSPEQAKGKAADKRSDIWSFGVIVYEVLTGRQPFRGATAVEMLGAVINLEPDLTAVPPPVWDLLRWCLEKDRKRRLAAISDARRMLEIRDAPTPAVSAAPRGIVRWVWPMVAAVAAAGAAVAWVTRPVPPAAPVTRFSVEAPPGTAFRFDFTATALSPDGRNLVFSLVREGENTRTLWIRPLDSLDAHMLPGTADVDTPFWSPDGKSVAFFADGKLKRLDLAAGAPLVLCDARTNEQRGEATGAWNRGGVILFGSSQGLMRVAASGGTPTPVTRLAAPETAHLYPEFLADGNHFLYLVRSGDPNARGIYVSSLARPQERIHLLQTTYKALFARDSGRLLFLRDGSLFAQRVNPANFALEGDPAALGAQVGARQNSAWASFWVSQNGVLAYRAGSELDKTPITWFSREGKRLETAAPEDTYSSLRIARGGLQLAVGRRDANGLDDIWILQFARSLMSRLTFDAQRETWPVWSPDGRKIAFASNRTGVYQIYMKDASGAGNEQSLTTTPYPKILTDWTADGRYILYSEDNPKTRDDIWALPVGGGNEQKQPIAVLQTPFDEFDPQVSPDGKWIAYNSTESGRSEIYIQAFPASAGPLTGGKWQVTAEGGIAPRWRADGKELYFVTPEYRKIMAAGIHEHGKDLEFDKPMELISVAMPSGNAYPYDVTADGQRFVVEEVTTNPRSAPLTIVLNWDAVLEK